MIVLTFCKAEDSIVRRACEEKNLFSHFYCSVCSQYIGKCEIIIFFTSSFIKKYSI